MHKSAFCTFLHDYVQFCAFLQAILAGKNAQKRTKKAQKHAKMHENAPLCADACNTPVYCTPVSVHPNCGGAHLYCHQRLRRGGGLEGSGKGSGNTPTHTPMPCPPTYEIFYPTSWHLSFDFLLGVLREQAKRKDCSCTGKVGPLDAQIASDFKSNPLAI